MWMSLFEWVTCFSLAYIYGQDETSQEEFSNVNGREYPHKISLIGGRSLEIKQTLAGCISRVLPQIVSYLSIPTPVSNIEKAMVRVVVSCQYQFIFSDIFFMVTFPYKKNYFLGNGNLLKFQKKKTIHRVILASFNL